MKKYVLHHKDGSLWAKGFMTGTQPEGYWEWFRKDGTKMRSGNFKNGVKIREWVTYDKNGRMYKVTKM